jgi:N-methylhydantoinase A
LGIGTVLVPKLAGALSALGMLLADRIRDYSSGMLGRTDFNAEYQRLEAQARAEMPRAKLIRTADLRYRGQSYELTVPWNGRNPAKPFHELHAKTYGYANEQREVEVVALRVRARLAVKRPSLQVRAEAAAETVKTGRFYTGGRWVRGPVLERAQVPAEGMAGPALVLDYGSTTLIPRGWRMKRDATDMLVIDRIR